MMAVSSPDKPVTAVYESAMTAAARRTRKTRERTKLIRFTLSSVCPSRHNGPWYAVSSIEDAPAAGTFPETPLVKQLGNPALNSFVPIRLQTVLYQFPAKYERREPIAHEPC